MRLTLRTLLAWLDDTLPPNEVKEIGRQVAESPFAQELVERIHRVTRQRRLTVPSGSGGEGVDPNLVAAYLDSELDPDQVADFERRCLTSDVLLAEVASAHQILSMIGHKAKVPGEARWRMYRLIKGPEARPRASDEHKAVKVAEPAPTWVREELSKTAAWESYGLPAIVGALVIALAFSAWKIVGPASSDLGNTAANVPKNAPPPAVDRQAPQGPVMPFGSDPTMPDATDINNGGIPEAGPMPTPAMDLPAPTPPAIAGLAIAEGSTGILLHRDRARGDWATIAKADPPQFGEPLLNLEPTRSILALGPLQIELIGETSLVATEPQAGTSGRITLATGRIKVRGLGSESPLEVSLDEGAGARTIPVRSSSGSVALERLATSGSPTSVLRIHADDGVVTVTSGDNPQTVDAPASIDVVFRQAADPADGRPELLVGNPKPAALPDWVTATRPSALEAQVAESFLKAYKSDRDPVAMLGEIATAGDSARLRELALAGLGAVDELDIVLVSLGARGNRNERLAAIHVLRQVLSRGPASLATLREHLQQVGGREADWAPTVEKLLIGYTTAEEAADGTILARLVRLLASDDVTVRELALDNLMTLTNRDAMGYDPDAPTQGSGLAEWQGLLKTKSAKSR